MGNSATQSDANDAFTGASGGGAAYCTLNNCTLTGNSVSCPSVFGCGGGAAIGSTLSVWASRFAASLLYGVEPRDPMTLIGAVGALTAVAACAGWVPARRAARVDPAAVLREG